MIKDAAHVFPTKQPHSFPEGTPYLSVSGPCQYLGSEILQENHIRGLWIAPFNITSLILTTYDKLDIWSLRLDTKTQSQILKL